MWVYKGQIGVYLLSKNNSNILTPSSQLNMFHSSDIENMLIQSRIIAVDLRTGFDSNILDSQFSNP